jgi:hypothetical protein
VLGVNRLTVQSWKRTGQYGRAPRLEQARLIIALSHDKKFRMSPDDAGRPLTYEDVYGAVIPEIGGKV